MKRMLPIGLPILMSTLILSNLGAIDITGTAPVFGRSPGSSLTDQQMDTFNDELGSTFNNALNQIRDQIKDIDSKPEKVIRGFGNASVYASTGATLRNYAGYKLFGVALGPMFGAQLPYSIFEVLGNPDIGSDVMKKLKDENDMAAGINAGLNLQFGLNMSFLVKNLYLGLKAGYFPGNAFLPDNMKFTTFSIGATVSYQFLPRRQLLPANLLLWRGVSFNSGVIYQGTNMGIEMPLDKVTEGSGDLTLTIDPKVALNIDVHTVTIPLEAVTSIRLLWFLNLAVGLGVDVGFGSSNIEGSATADINADPKGTYAGHVQQDRAGSLSLSAGGKEGPSLFNPKLLLGLGLSIGPVLIDFPITFYLDNGYSIGVTLGVNF